MSQPLSLKNKVFVIAGACGGIGSALAKLMVKHEAIIIIVDRNTQALEALENELMIDSDQRANIKSLRVDITSEQDLSRLVKIVESAYSQLDGIVNCAGILRLSETLKTVEDTTLEEWETILRVNLTGTFLFNKHFIPVFIRQGSGDIINISSVSGLQGRAFDGPYCASKFAIIGLSESIAAELNSYGIRVQCILPDAVETDLWKQNGSESIRPLVMLQAERVAEIIIYMLLLPRDTYMLNPVVKPLGRKKRRSRT